MILLPEHDPALSHTKHELGTTLQQIFFLFVSWWLNKLRIVCHGSLLSSSLKSQNKKRNCSAPRAFRIFYCLQSKWIFYFMFKHELFTMLSAQLYRMIEVLKTLRLFTSSYYPFVWICFECSFTTLHWIREGITKIDPLNTLLGTIFTYFSKHLPITSNKDTFQNPSYFFILIFFLSALWNYLCKNVHIWVQLLQNWNINKLSN